MSQAFKFDLRKRPTASDIRDARDFVDSKRIKREPIKLVGAATGTTSWVPTAAGSSFKQLLSGFRRSNTFANTVRHIDSLARSVRLRSGLGFPVPRQVDQLADHSLVFFWGPEGHGITIMARSEGIRGLVGGKAGSVESGETTTLLDALWGEAKLQQGRKWQQKS